MQEYIFVDAAEVGIEVLVFPLIFLSGGFFAVIPAVVYAGCNYIFLAGFYQGR